MGVVEKKAKKGRRDIFPLIIFPFKTQLREGRTLKGRNSGLEKVVCKERGSGMRNLTKRKKLQGHVATSLYPMYLADERYQFMINESWTWVGLLIFYEGFIWACLSHKNFLETVKKVKKKVRNWFRQVLTDQNTSKKLCESTTCNPDWSK